MYAGGAYGSNNMYFDFLWNNTWGPPFFRVVIPRYRLQDIMEYLRFDMKSTRSERLKTDKFALFSDIWNIFIENWDRSYNPGEYLVMNEQLFASKARCKFTQYMPNKPSGTNFGCWLG